MIKFYPRRIFRVVRENESYTDAIISFKRIPIKWKVVGTGTVKSGQVVDLGTTRTVVAKWGLHISVDFFFFTVHYRNY